MRRIQAGYTKYHKQFKRCYIRKRNWTRRDIYQNR